MGVGAVRALAGRQGQVDYATFTLPWRRRYALLMVLGHSRVLWLHFYRRQTMAVLIEELDSAFGWFGGVPEELSFDQTSFMAYAFSE